MIGSRMRFAGAALGLAVMACGGDRPERIAYGTRACDYCHMTISDDRFAAELVTPKGKVYAFDSIECLLAFRAHPTPADSGGAAWVTDFARPGTLMRADSARYLRTTALGTPMGRGLVAVSPLDTVVASQLGAARTMSWSEVVASESSLEPAR